MAINNHKNLFPSTLDDIESLLYTLMKLANINLPWINVITSGQTKQYVYAYLKENIDIYVFYVEKNMNYFQKYIYI